MSLDALKDMKAFLIFSGQIFKTTIITLQEMRLKLKCLNETCTSSKSIMQFTRPTFSDSLIFIEKKTVENRMWAKSEFLWAIFYYQLTDCLGNCLPSIAFAVLRVRQQLLRKTSISFYFNLCISTARDPRRWRTCKRRRLGKEGGGLCGQRYNFAGQKKFNFPPVCSALLSVVGS